MQKRYMRASVLTEKLGHSNTMVNKYILNINQPFLTITNEPNTLINIDTLLTSPGFLNEQYVVPTAVVLLYQIHYSQQHTFRLTFLQV